MSTGSNVIARTDRQTETQTHTDTQTHRQDENITSTAYMGGNNEDCVINVKGTFISGRRFFICLNHFKSIHFVVYVATVPHKMYIIQHKIKHACNYVPINYTHLCHF